MATGESVYVVRFTSPIRAVLFLVLWCCISIVGLLSTYDWLITEKLLSPSTWSGALVLFFSVGLIGVGYLLTLRVASGIVELQVDDHRLAWRWRRRYYLSFAKNCHVRWDEVSDYVFQPDYRYEQLKFTLRNGKIIRFYHLYEQRRDDYSQFVFEFKDQIAQRTLSSDLGQPPIRIGKTFYETKAAMVLLVVLIAACLVFFIASLVIAKKRAVSFGILTLIGSGMSYYAYHVIQARRK